MFHYCWCCLCRYYQVVTYISVANIIIAAVDMAHANLAHATITTRYLSACTNYVVYYISTKMITKCRVSVRRRPITLQTVYYRVGEGVYYSTKTWMHFIYG